MGFFGVYVDYDFYFFINEAGSFFIVGFGEFLILFGWVVVRYLFYFFIYFIGNYLKILK